MALANQLIALGVPPAQAEQLGYGDLTQIAAAGTTQLTATPIKEFVTQVEVTAGALNTGVRLPADVEFQQPYFILNSSATTANVYPPTGCSINGGSANASVSIAQNVTIVFERIDRTRWIAQTTSGMLAGLSVATANGFAGSVGGGLSPVVTLSTTQTGAIVGDGTALTGYPVLPTANGGLPSVANPTALALISTTLYTLSYVISRKRFFFWNSSNLSTQVTADTQKGVYIPPANDTSGASGAWQLIITGQGPTLDDFGGVGDSSTINDTAIGGAQSWAAAQSPVGTIMLPQGNYKFNTWPTITVGGITYIGAGPSSRFVSNSVTAGPAISIAGAGGVKIKSISFLNLSIESNVVNTGPAFSLVSVQDFKFDGTIGKLGSFGGIATLGDSTYVDDVVSAIFNGYFGWSGATNAFELVSGSILTIPPGSKVNGSGVSTEAVFSQANATRNWDGAYYSHIVCETAPTIMKVTGKGIANVEAFGVTTDHNKAGAYIFAPQAGGTVQFVSVVGGTLDGTLSATSFGAKFTTGSGTIRDVAFVGVKIINMGLQGVVQTDAGLQDTTFTGCTLLDVGQQGQPGMDFNTGTGIIVASNVIRDTNGTAKMTYGINWGGSSGNRIGGTTQNVITNPLTAAVNGTP